ncbi:unannotated protein [freshwater metagenome]|uniref:Unannotated protein n=1 Tax=freshwater metagenome TaxID=449393 RepID=A0A6J6LLA7_9ZZZZ
MTLSIADPIVASPSVPALGAVKAHQSDPELVAPAWRGSPVSRVALTVEALTGDDNAGDSGSARANESRPTAAQISIRGFPYESPDGSVPVAARRAAVSVSVSFGYATRRSANAPTTCGVAIEVPVELA